MRTPLKSRVGLSLQARVNIVLGGIFFVGLCLAVLSALKEEHTVAESEVLRDARLVMDFADVTRAYTNEEVKGHIAVVDGGEFPKPAVPSFASRRVAERLTAMERYEDITLREVSPNPMNPENLPDSFEVGLINRFKEDVQEEFNGRVANADGETEIYVARPIYVTEESCLSCHGSPTGARKDLAAAYGELAGRNWELNSLVGIQVVRAPIGPAVTQANHRVLRVGVGLLSIFALMAFALNLLLRRYFLGPLAKLTQAAERMSTGERLELKGEESGEELRSLALALTRLRLSVDKAIALAERPGRGKDRTEELRMSIPMPSKEAVDGLRTRAKPAEPPVTPSQPRSESEG